MAAKVKQGLPDQSDLAKVMITMTVLFEPGYWNQGKVFSYDPDDPLGKNPRNQLLSTVLETHKGNCVSLPTLFLAVMERVDPEIQINGVQAPMHLFCRFHDRQTGQVINIETTNGTVARDEWIIEQCHVTQDQIDRGIFMKDLTKQQYVARILVVLEKDAVERGDFAQALEYNEMILDLDPNYAQAMVNRGALLHRQGQELLASAGEEGLDEVQREKARALHTKGEEWIEKARQRGWTELVRHDDEYLDRIERQKTKPGRATDGHR